MFRVCGRSSLIILGGEGEEEEDDDGEEVEAEEGLVVEEDWAGLGLPGFSGDRSCSDYVWLWL